LKATNTDIAIGKVPNRPNSIFKDENVQLLWRY